MYEILSTQRVTLIYDFYQRKIVQRAFKNQLKKELNFYTIHFFLRLNLSAVYMLS